MSGFTMRKFRKFFGHRIFQIVVYSLVGISMIFFFAISPFSGAGRRAEGVADDNTPVAIVNGETITAGTLNRLLELSREQNSQLISGPAGELQNRYQSLQGLINATFELQVAKRQGIEASSSDIEKVKEEYLNQRLAEYRMRYLPQGKGTDKELDRALQERGQSLDQLKEALLAQVPEEFFAFRATGEKWRTSLVQRYTPNDQMLRQYFENLTPARIAISAEKRSKDQARQRAEEIYSKLQGGMKFEEAAKQYSDDPDEMKKKGGRLTGSDYLGIHRTLAGMFKPEDIAKIMALQQGQYTPPLESADGKGFFIFQMVERKPDLPKDLEQKKKEYKEQFAQQRADMEMNAILMTARKNAKIEIKDPLLTLYQNWFSTFGGTPAQRIKTSKEVLAGLDDLLGKPTSTTPKRLARWLQIRVLNTLLDATKDPKQKKEYEDKKLLALTQFFQQEGGEDVYLRIQLAELLIQRNQKEQAVNHLKNASGLAYRPNEFPVHEQLRDLYKKAGYQNLAAEEDKRAKQLKANWDEMRAAQRAQEQAAMQQFKQQQKAEEQKAQKQTTQKAQSKPAQGQPKEQKQTPAQK